MSKTQAARVANRRIRRLRGKVPTDGRVPAGPLRAVANEVLAVAVKTQDRAYQFKRLQDGSLIEVRVWPDGQVKLTEVDDRGHTVVKEPALPKLKR